MFSGFVHFKSLHSVNIEKREQPQGSPRFYYWILEIFTLTIYRARQRIRVAIQRLPEVL